MFQFRNVRRESLSPSLGVERSGVFLKHYGSGANGVFSNSERSVVWKPPRLLYHLGGKAKTKRQYMTEDPDEILGIRSAENLAEPPVGSERRSKKTPVGLRLVALLGAALFGTVAGYMSAITLAPLEPDSLVVVPGEDANYDAWTDEVAYPRNDQGRAVIPHGEIYFRNLRLNSSGKAYMLSYETGGGDSPTAWSPKYLVSTPPASMYIFHDRPNGGPQSLTLVARDYRAEFHDFNVMMRNRDSFLRFLRFSVPFGATAGLLLVATSLNLRDRKGSTKAQ